MRDVLEPQISIPVCFGMRQVDPGARLPRLSMIILFEKIVINDAMSENLRKADYSFIGGAVRIRPGGGAWPVVSQSLLTLVEYTLPPMGLVFQLSSTDKNWETF